MAPTTTELRSEVPEWSDGSKYWASPVLVLPGGVGIWPRQAVLLSPGKEAEAHKALTRFSVATAEPSHLSERAFILPGKSAAQPLR
jgi:hypothetical protein